MAASAQSHQWSSSDAENLVRQVIKAVMRLAGVRIDRAAFLRNQLKSHCPEEQVQAAVDTKLADAGVSDEVIDELANSIIKSHVMRASGTSFVAGLPGGIAMAITIPTDLSQLMWHAIVVAQKLAYLYGWPDLQLEDGVDEETEMRILMLIGSMYGIEGSNRLLAEIASRFANEVARTLPKQALTKTAYYPIIKEALKWFGIKLTKKTFAEGISKVVPIVGGGVSASVTALTLRGMSYRLKNHLRTLEYAKPTQKDLSPQQDPEQQPSAD
ncbi:MAG: hypothetical protein OXG39_01745 [Chloroflexi bacterium]|nr:hypothetical protein [Chloroflexota bacterium]